MVTINFIDKENVQVNVTPAKRFSNSSKAALIFFILAVIWIFATDEINNRLILFLTALPTLLSFLVYAILVIKETKCNVSRNQKNTESQEVK